MSVAAPDVKKAESGEAVAIRVGREPELREDHPLQRPDRAPPARGELRRA